MLEDGLRETFLKAVLANGEQRLNQFSAAVWYDATRRDKSESVVADLLSELEAFGMPRQHRSRFAGLMLKSPILIKGKRSGTVRLNPSRILNLDAKYEPYLGTRKIRVSSEYLPGNQLPASRPYLRRLAEQVNGSIECGYFDAAAVMGRRIVEILLIEIYVMCGRSVEIQPTGIFMMLDKLITKFANDSTFVKSRTLVKDILEIKNVGDTAAHSRVYITSREDLSDLNFKFRRVVSELLVLSGIH